MKIKLKRINKKRPWEKNNPKVVYSKIIPAETIPVIGNWDSATLERYKSIKVPKKFYMTFQQAMKTIKGKRYYENKIRRSN